MPAIHLPVVRAKTPAWNKGRIIGQKRPLQPKHVWAIRVRLEIADNIRDLALFNMAIDCKLRGCDLVRLRVRDVFVSGHMKERASVMQSKTQRPVQFEITEQTRKAVQRWIESPAMFGCDDLWPSRFHGSPHLSTRQYARILRGWVTSIGLEPSAYGTHSMRRTKAAQIYKKDREPAGRTAIAWPYQDGQHRALPWDRVGRRARDFRGRRDVILSQSRRALPHCNGRECSSWRQPT